MVCGCPGGGRFWLLPFLFSLEGISSLEESEGQETFFWGL